jgi:O-antigen ligase
MEQLQTAATYERKANTADRWDLGLAFLVLFIFTLNVNIAHMYPVFQPFRLQLLFGTAAFFFCLLRLATSQGRGNWTPPVLWYFGYLAVACLSIERAAAVGLQELGIEVVSTIAKQAVILLVITHYASTRFGFERVLFAYIIGLFVYQLHSIKALLFGGALVDGRFESYVGQTMNSDNIGVFCVMMMFVTLELWRVERRPFLRNVLLGMTFVSLLLAVLTQTRAAFLCLVVVGAMWFWQQQNKTQISGVLALLLCVFLIIGSQARSSKGTYFDRIMTIFASEDARDFNSRSRVHLWGEGLRLALEYPLLGVGSGATKPYLNATVDGVELKSHRNDARMGFSLHQTFLQIWVERGLIALFAFFSFLYGVWRSLRNLLKQASNRESTEFGALAGIRHAVLVYVVGAFFMSVDNDWAIIVLGGLASGATNAMGRDGEKEAVVRWQRHTPATVQ